MLPASARYALTNGDVNMRAGRGSRYPVVTIIRADRQVSVHGGLSDRNWYDVSRRRNCGGAGGQNDDGDRNTRRPRQIKVPEEKQPGMRCTTPNADPSCPDNSHGQHMQLNKD